jgi:hypothetical protein
MNAYGEKEASLPHFDSYRYIFIKVIDGTSHDTVLLGMAFAANGLRIHPQLRHLVRTLQSSR